MAAQVTAGSASQNMHTSGIYADMTLDGPEIGTLVMVLDRAKNLPNRKTMGKQNPYCAARLGKEAKKTATDMRGGQTPKWDQELRFTVHDSPDYNSLKLSVFNDDKKTDLIGETWIDLTDVIHPGGGQSDQWHGLSWKGRYAGDIRIELTYYDSRPKVEKHYGRDKKQSRVDSAEQSPSSSLGGPRQLQTSVRRRPLPTELAQSQGPALARVQTMPESIPVPRNHHLPQTSESNIHSHAETFEHSPIENFRRSGSGMSDAIGRTPPGLSGGFPSYQRQQHSQIQALDYNGNISANVGGHQTQDMFQQEPLLYGNAADSYIPVSDDPYALEAVEDYQNHLEDHESVTQFQQARHNRVQALSGSQNSRSPPSIPLTHAYTAPMYGSSDQVEYFSNASLPTGPHQPIMEKSSPYHSEQTVMNSSSNRFTDNDNISATISDENHAYSSITQTRPPPPPAHRNSAPAVARMTFGRSPPMQHSSPAVQSSRTDNPNHSEYNDKYHYHGEQGYYNEGQTRTRPSFTTFPAQTTVEQLSVPQNAESQNRHQRSTDGLSGQFHDPQIPAYSNRQPVPAGVPAFDPRHNYGHPSRVEFQNTMQMNHDTQPQHGIEREEHRYFSPNHDVITHQFPIPPPLIKPRAMSPNRPAVSTLASQPQQVLNSATPYTTSQGIPTSVPFSPDSFAIFNPRHSNPTTPTTSATDMQTVQRRISPQYSTQSGSTPQSKAPSPKVVENVEAPIIGSDGRVRDPSDHLPPSSYAPEPDRKGGRQTTVVRVRNRFGPRDAPPIPVTTRQPRSAPASPLVNKGVGQRAVLQQAAPNTLPLTGRALNSSQQGLLNAQHGHASNPISARGYGYDRVEMFAPPVPDKIPLDAPEFGADTSTSDAQLSRNMTALGFDDVGGAFKGPLSRMRKSRWGA